MSYGLHPRSLILHDHPESLRRQSVVNCGMRLIAFPSFRLKFANRLNPVWKRIGGSDDVG